MSAVNSRATGSTPLAEKDQPSPYRGWLIGFLLIIAVFVVGATFWFIFHP
jgi:hypothetical protein